MRVLSGNNEKRRIMFSAMIEFIYELRIVYERRERFFVV